MWFLLLFVRTDRCVPGQVGSCELNLARVGEYSYSNSSHPLRRLPKTSVRFVVETRMSPLSFSTPTMRSCVASLAAALVLDLIFGMTRIISCVPTLRNT